MELVRTHTFLRKHATGKAKIELHVLSVERGLSWEGAQEKWAELTGIDEGFYLANQVSFQFEWCNRKCFVRAFGLLKVLLQDLQEKIFFVDSSGCVRMWSLRCIIVLAL